MHKRTSAAPAYRLCLVLSLALLASCASQVETPVQGEVSVKLIAVNDFHGNINPPRSPTRIPDPASPDRPFELPTGGVEYVSALMAELKARNPLHAVVGAGDLIGGSPLVSALFHHEPAIEALSKAGLEFTSVGNHEFDAGRVELLRMQNGGCFAGSGQDTCRNGKFAGAQFQYLAANVIDQATGRSLFPPYAIKKFKAPNGASFQIAFIGLVLEDTASLVVASGVAGLEFTDEADAANALIPELRSKGIEAIVVLIHEGGLTAQKVFDDPTCPEFTGAIRDIVRRFDPAIDVVVSGHTHRPYICHDSGRLVTSAGAEGRIITDIDVTIDTATKDIVRSQATQLAVVNDTAPNPLPLRYPTLAKDPKLTPLVTFYNDQAAPLAQREVARISADIVRAPATTGESALGDFIADAQLIATRAPEAGGAQIALMNRGGMRADLRADKGYITYSDVFSVHPFNNGLITLTLTGEQIDEVLELQWGPADTMLQVSEGFSYEWDGRKPVGERVDFASISLNGQPLEATKSYRVTVNEFLAMGGDNFKVLAKASDRVRGIMDVEALERYVTARSPISAPALGRIRRADSGPAASGSH
ncbi:5'-nucleotidase [Povalibacter uvarum]|uniref:5'-nucleotidase n=1 Tax=Povalibacter uvarum TaxID=732238 RepID=A0A841HT36_9GAMM|nr:bifunctional metallophosphatase/5'-nucleotidase [Povalibacter uvarum]MBB6095380.1 5'-nucleotidase [Povalibacter uvarum]